MAEQDTLVLGATGKVGSRVTRRLREVGAPVREEAQTFRALAAAGGAEVTDTVERITGRPPIPFRTYAERAAARGAWGQAS